MAMRIVTINIPDQYLGCMETLIKLGLFNSRSQVAREALKEFIDRENVFMQDMEPEMFEKIKEVQIQRK